MVFSTLRPRAGFVTSAYLCDNSIKQSVIIYVSRFSFMLSLEVCLWMSWRFSLVLRLFFFASFSSLCFFR